VKAEADKHRALNDRIETASTQAISSGRERLFID
jgi:hypothetical protein